MDEPYLAVRHPFHLSKNEPDVLADCHHVRCEAVEKAVDQDPARGVVVVEGGVVTGVDTLGNAKKARRDEPDDVGGKEVGVDRVRLERRSSPIVRQSALGRSR